MFCLVVLLCMFKQYCKLTSYKMYRNMQIICSYVLEDLDTC